MTPLFSLPITPAGATGAFATGFDARSTAPEAAGAGMVLRAEVEPEARGLGVQAHAERVLAALQGGGAERT